MVKKRYWLEGADGAKAPVEGADVRDRQTAAGWVECGEPASGDRVWAQHEVHGGWAKFPASVLHVWQRIGWQPGCPPEEVTDPGAALMAPVALRAEDNATGEPSPTTTGTEGE